MTRTTSTNANTGSDGDEQDNLARLVDAMLQLVAADGWRPITLGAVALRAGVAMSDAHALCGDRVGLLIAYARRVDVAACADAEAGSDADTRYDELLDILMRRFEILNANREAVARLLGELPAAPCTLLRCLPAARRSFAGLARAAGYPDLGIAGMAMTKALTAVWLMTQRDWLRDDTPDLAATMASLDRNLRRAIDLLAPLVGHPVETATDEV